MKMTVLIKVSMFLLVAVSLLLPIAVYAEGSEQLSETQEQPAVIKDTTGLRLQLVQHTQNPFTKEVKFELVIYSLITSDRVQVNWSVTGASQLVGEKQQDLAVTPGKYYVVSTVVKPRTNGTNEVKAEVEAFQAGGTRLATASKVYGSFGGGEVFPVTNEYRLAQWILYLQLVATWVTILGALGLAGWWGFGRFRLWLSTREDS